MPTPWDRQHAPDSPRCHACGYDLRGTRADFCPECGEAKVGRRLVFLDIHEFDAMRVALSAAGVPFRYTDPRGGFTEYANLVYGMNFRAEMTIALPDLSRAMRVLDEAGIGMPVPFVDPQHPWCPVCAGELVPLEAEVCAGCGTHVQWIDDEPMDDGRVDEHPQ